MNQHVTGEVDHSIRPLLLTFIKDNTVTGIHTTHKTQLSKNIMAALSSTLSLIKANFTKPRKHLNPELSSKALRCDHLNESSRLILSDGGVHVVVEQNS